MAQPVRLLLVEDEPTQRMILCHRLTRAGYLVETAENGQDALQRILRGDIQILITDWDMPGMDGVTLCRRAREASLAGYLYMLLLTSHVSTADIVAGLEAGADDYLRKPADEAELLARLTAGRRILALEQSLREAQGQLRRMATTDPMLGVFNRRYLMDELPREIERARRYQRPLSLIMADLDHFKHINDTHGHAAGDTVLIQFAQTSVACLRSSDWLARAGGEEFIVVLPETAIEGALAAAQKIRLACESIAVDSPTGLIRVTASLGVASLSVTSDLPEAVAKLLQQADQALYHAKHAGRNQVHAAVTDPSRARALTH